MCKGIDKYRSDYGTAERLAVKMVLLIKEDVRIYAKNGQHGEIYDCEPVLAGKNKETEISIVNYN